MNPQKIARAYWLLLHPYTSLAVSAITVLLVFISGFNSSNFFLLRIGIIMLFIQFSIGISNDLLDQVYDTRAKQHKPIPSGMVNPHMAVFLFVLLTSVAIILSLPLGFKQLWILLLGLSCGLAYNLGLKRTLFSWLPLSLAVPTLLLWVMSLTSNISSLLSWTYLIGLFLGPALNLANQIADAEAAAVSGEKSLIYYLGIKNSSRICSLLFLFTALIIVLIMIFTGRPFQPAFLYSIIAVIFTIFFFILAEREYRIILWPLALVISAFLGLSWRWILN